MLGPAETIYPIPIGRDEFPPCFESDLYFIFKFYILFLNSNIN